MATMRGAELIARNLKQQGVQYMFGIVGFPVMSIAAAAQKEGITYIGMRNEQAASYAAQAAGYLTGRPQVCLVVSGPGVIHALAGLANAKSNCWPMLLIGGASQSYYDGMGAFQEEEQVMAAHQFCKSSRRIEDARRIPYYIEQALRTSMYGRPGPVYLDLPDDIIRQEVDEENITPASTIPAEIPRSQALSESVDAALDLLESAERPLVVVGKGMAWSRAEDAVRDFIEKTRLPFLASPMGKGIIDDNHPLSVGAARTLALREADVIFLMGARLNWIMHFGRNPRFSKDVKIIQLDVSAEEISHSVAAEVALLGDGKAVVQQINSKLADRQWFFPEEADWRTSLADKAADNHKTVQPMVEDDSAPMNYYRALEDIRKGIPDDCFLINEGSNTLDIGRTQLPNTIARSRLDAGTSGTIGVGLGFAIAAAVVDPARAVVAVEGDSAFGFSGMEVETICRYKLPIKIVILNNNGIGFGDTELPSEGQVRPHALLPGARYDKVMAAFGGLGLVVSDPKDLQQALAEAMEFDGPALVNVLIDTRAGRKPQQFSSFG
jgi:2-hydroxyacyl-CoA lyase 1|tara:strand:+ start:26542 stop:28197 length:1656 start_codon:yes stop_codon:yes gene_type:complete